MKEEAREEHSNVAARNSQCSCYGFLPACDDFSARRRSIDGERTTLVLTSFLPHDGRVALLRESMRIDEWMVIGFRLEYCSRLR